MGNIKKYRRKIKYSLIYFLVIFLIFLSNAMPRSAWLAFCGCLGRIVGYFAVQSKKLSIRHLTLVFGKGKSPGEIEKLACDMFMMLGKNVGDVLRASKIDSLAELEKFVVMKGMENFEEVKVLFLLLVI